MLKRIELMELSIKTLSFSLRLRVKGVRRTSLLALFELKLKLKYYYCYLLILIMKNLYEIHKTLFFKKP